VIARLAHSQTSKATPEKSGKSGSPRSAEAAPANNPVWQSLALRPIGLQKKLTVGQPDDPFEQEADRVADHVMRLPDQQSGGPMLIQRQPAGNGQQPPQQQQPPPSQPQQAPNLMKLYSFGPSGAGRVMRDSGTTIFSPPAPVDANGNDLVQAGTAAQPVLSRLGRYFTLDEVQRPLTPPVPDSRIVVETTWRADDRSHSWRTMQEATGTYNGPNQPLSSSVGTEYIFRNDRPGVLYLGYFLDNPTAPSWLLLIHTVHYVNDPAAPVGASVAPGRTPDSSSSP
jgi:hypothetical protein